MDLDPDIRQELLGNAAVTKLLEGPERKPPTTLPEAEMLSALEAELSSEELIELDMESPEEEEESDGVDSGVVDDSLQSLGSGSAIPHEDKIQEAFGHHPVSGISASVGGAAGMRAEQMDSDAFAVGESVGMGASPDLWTMAHESAHVIQQRAGVPLEEGEAGDSYERHADAVADAVVRGESVQELLDETSASPSAVAPATTIQRSGGLPTPPFGDDVLRNLSKEQLEELYRRYRKSHGKEAEKVKRMQKSKGFRGSSVKRKRKHLSRKASKGLGKTTGRKAGKRLTKKLARRAAGAVLRKIPLLAVSFFAADWASGGFGHAVNELVWPLSALWKK